MGYGSGCNLAEGDSMNIHFDTSDVMDKLGKISENLTDGLQAALGEAGEIVRKDAVLSCPVDTGRLRQSIVSTVEGNSAVIGPAVDYGAYVEFGTGAQGDKSVAHTTKKQWTYYSGGSFHTTSGQPPRPFLVPALKNNSDKIKRIIRQAVMK